MKIMQYMRRDAARLTGLGLVTGLAAMSAGHACKADTQTSSSLSHAIFAPAATNASGGDASPVHTPEVQQALDQAAVETAATARRVVEAQAAQPAPTELASAARVPHAQHALIERSVEVSMPSNAAIAFGYPLPGRTVNSRFGLRQLSFEPRARMHDGVDIAAPTGSEIHAAAAGVVERTGLSSSYGNFVEVAHADGLTTFYAHMSRTAGLKPGAQVNEGEVLGFVGSTGHSTGPHLHFEVRKAGAPLNPQDFMGRQFASAADLPVAQGRASMMAALKRPLRVLASWRVRGHVRGGSFRYAALHHGRSHTARG